MKTFNQTFDSHYRHSLAVLGLTCVLTFAPATISSAEVADEDKKASPGFFERMKQWQDEMSDKFSDTFKDLRKSPQVHDQSSAIVLADLREKKDSYVLRLNLPDRDLDKVEVNLKDNDLTITSPATGQEPRYQQTLILTGLAPDAKPAIERNQNKHMMMITVPKAATTAGDGKSDRPATHEFRSPIENWDLDVLNRMERMSREMDRVFEDAFGDFRSLPEYREFFDESRFGSSVVTQEEGENYVIRAYLPGRDLKDLNVTVENQTLRIEAKAEKTEEEKTKDGKLSYKAQYAQMITLPGPVMADQMKIDRKDEMVVVTLPKAKPAK